MLSGRRFVRILLLPVLALVFLFGWLMYSVGGDRSRTKKKLSKRDRPHDLEIGAISEMEGEVLSQSHSANFERKPPENED
jgi:hypothetical protein